MIKSSILAVILSVATGFSARGDWPNWLGPVNSGASPAGSPPVHWSRTEGVAWTTELGAPTASSPIIWQNHVFITSRAENGGKTYLHSIDRRSGKLRWTRELNPQSAIADISSALSTDGNHLVSFQSNGDLKVFNLDGQELWKQNLQAVSGWTPSLCAVQGGKVFVQQPLGLRGRPESTTGCRVTAFHARDGKQAWQQEFTRDSKATDAPSFSLVPSPHSGTQTLLVTAFGRVHCLKQSDGRSVWESKPGELTQGQPVKEMSLLGDNLLLVTSREDSSLTAFTVSSEKGLSRLWNSPTSGPLLRPHALLNGSGLFLQSEAGNAIESLDARSGQKKWSAALPAGDWSRAPYLGAEGKIYCLGTNGDVAVLNSETGRVLTWTPMRTTEHVAGVPGMAISAHQLFVSVGSRIHCIEGAVVGSRDPAKPAEVERIGEPPGINRRRLPL